MGKIISIFVLSIILLNLYLSSYIINNEPNFSSELIVKYNFNFDGDLIKHFKNNSKTHVIIPIGRLYSLNQEIQISKNNEMYDAEIFMDFCGSYWVNLTFDIFENENKSEIMIKRISRKRSLELYQEKNQNISMWLNPSKFIDSENSSIINLAYNICSLNSRRLDNSQKIHKFVNSNIKYKKSKNNDMNASEVYNQGYGVCKDKSRLFVAICRAKGIPARTITGFLCIDSKPINNLHMWTEILDEDGYWHQICPTNNKFDFYDLRFIDYTYAVYQNPYSNYYLKEMNNSIVSYYPYQPISEKTEIIVIKLDLNKILPLLIAITILRLSLLNFIMKLIIKK